MLMRYAKRGCPNEARADEMDQRMKRREFMALAGGMVAWPLASWAQQQKNENAHNACGVLLQPRGVALVQNKTPAGAAAAGV